MASGAKAKQIAACVATLVSNPLGTFVTPGLLAQAEREEPAASEEGDTPLKSIIIIIIVAKKKKEKRRIKFSGTLGSPGRLAFPGLLLLLPPSTSSVWRAWSRLQQVPSAPSSRLADCPLVHITSP